MNLFSMFNGIFLLFNLGVMIYIVYLFHTLAMSNKRIAESMERMVSKMDQFIHKS